MSQRYIKKINEVAIVDLTFIFFKILCNSLLYLVSADTGFYWIQEISTILSIEKRLVMPKRCQSLVIKCYVSSAQNGIEIP